MRRAPPGLIDVPDVRGFPVYDAHEPKLAAMRKSRTKPFEPEMMRHLQSVNGVFELLATSDVPPENEAILFGTISHELQNCATLACTSPDGTQWNVVDLAAGAVDRNPKTPLSIVADSLLLLGEPFSGVRLHGKDYSLHELYEHDKEKWIREKPYGPEALAQIHSRCGIAYLMVRDSARACDEFIAAANLDSRARPAAFEACIAVITRDGQRGRFVTHSGAVLTCEGGDLLLVDGAPLPSLGAKQQQQAEPGATGKGPRSQTADRPAPPAPQRTIRLSHRQLGIAAAVCAISIALAFAAGRMAKRAPSP